MYQPSLQQHKAVQYTPYSPNHSGATTPTNVSPTASFTSHNLGSQMHAQLRRPKGPMYVPAVLRPTERPARSSPPKGSEIRHGSIDRPASKDLGRRVTVDSLGSSLSEIERVASEEGESVLGDVTGPPSRNHWKLDDSSTTCNEPGCYRTFSLLCRRHHCRRCGDIFCYEHSSHEIKLDQDALFHPRGFHSRACDRCWSTYRQWEAARSSRTNSASSQGSDSSNDATLANAQAQAQGHQFKVGSYVGSVPRDWNWSTF
ncbi:hypothetical protein K490DRAFT_42514 [Saccharata proteae CBS 121410]|uniref:FYVE-type domain-containing protein n=1 Tax=Saccharata proteae CBS 121410 TaxID=1314787 RepID=A0A9P4HVY9_9PEZI|nr:hypothetical protein K490DRAFT_42514 [Saccharata proteae CBS 121410]